MTVDELQEHSEQWLLDCEIRSCSAGTITSRRLYIKNLIWFLNNKKHLRVTVAEMRAFFAYLKNGHTEPGGRWGRANETEPVKSGTVATYHRNLRAFFNWLVEQEVLCESPMRKVAAPIDRADQVQPFTEDQVLALLAASRKSRNAKRDEAILLLLLDSGLRASELCGLNFEDVNLSGMSMLIRNGKGGKSRSVRFSTVTRKALYAYLRSDGGREPKEPFFMSERGDPMTRNGLLQLFHRLGEDAGVTGVRVSPHTMRHRAALTFIENGGGQFSLMTMLGHTDLKQTKRYVDVGAADLERQHTLYSPVDSIVGRGKKGR